MNGMNEVDDMKDKTEYENLAEKCISTEDVFDGKILHLINDRVLLPNGKEARRETVRHVGAVCMIPVDEDGNAIVERQYRYPVDEVLTEVPAGKLNYKGEPYLDAGKRELIEETGYTGDEWTELGFFYPAAAYSDEKIMMYLVRGLHEGKQKLDEDEFLDVKKVPLSQLAEEVMEGKITDSKTQVAILKAYNLLK